MQHSETGGIDSQSIKLPVSYFTKALDSIIQMYLRVTAATLDLLQEAEEFTPGQPTMVCTSHCMLSLLEQKSGYCLTLDHLGGYQVILLDNSNVTPRLCPP